MIITLFIVGLLTALGCGANVICSEASWPSFAIWVLGGFGGAGLMVLAIAISRGVVL